MKNRLKLAPEAKQKKKRKEHGPFKKILTLFTFCVFILICPSFLICKRLYTLCFLSSSKETSFYCVVVVHYNKNIKRKFHNNYHQFEFTQESSEFYLFFFHSLFLYGFNWVVSLHPHHPQIIMHERSGIKSSYVIALWKIHSSNGTTMNIQLKNLSKKVNR